MLLNCIFFFIFNFIFSFLIIIFHWALIVTIASWASLFLKSATAHDEISYNPSLYDRQRAVRSG